MHVFVAHLSTEKLLTNLSRRCWIPPAGRATGPSGGVDNSHSGHRSNLRIHELNIPRQDGARSPDSSNRSATGSTVDRTTFNCRAVSIRVAPSSRLTTSRYRTFSFAFSHSRILATKRSLARGASVAQFHPWEFLPRVECSNPLTTPGQAIPLTSFQKPRAS